MRRDRYLARGPEAARVQRACQDFLDANPSNNQLAEVVVKNVAWREQVARELLRRDPSDTHLRLIVEKVPEWRPRAIRLLSARMKWNADCILRNT